MNRAQFQPCLLSRFWASSALRPSAALQRSTGYPTVWRMHHIQTQPMAERESCYTLAGHVQVDDAYLGRKRHGGKAGCCSEYKMPFVGANSLDEQAHPVYAKLLTVPGFTSQAIVDWARTVLRPRICMLSDGLTCFNSVTEAGCHHENLPESQWVNIVLGNFKTSLSGAYHAFKFAKYVPHYLANVAYRFNRKFNLRDLPVRLLSLAVHSGSRMERWLRLADASC